MKNRGTQEKPPLGKHWLHHAKVHLEADATGNPQSRRKRLFSCWQVFRGLLTALNLEAWKGIQKVKKAIIAQKCEVEGNLSNLMAHTHISVFRPVVPCSRLTVRKRFLWNLCGCHDFHQRHWRDLQEQRESLSSTWQRDRPHSHVPHSRNSQIIRVAGLNFHLQIQYKETEKLGK